MACVTSGALIIWQIDRYNPQQMRKSLSYLFLQNHLLRKSIADDDECRRVIMVYQLGHCECG
jgi:hypothetical protein